MKLIEGRLPSLDEVRAAIVPPLSESYWWFEGWNFNRPIIAEIGIGVRRKKVDPENKNGPYVWCRFFEEGFNNDMSDDEATYLAKHGASIRFTGPILFRT